MLQECRAAGTAVSYTYDFPNLELGHATWSNWPTDYLAEIINWLKRLSLKGEYLGAMVYINGINTYSEVQLPNQVLQMK